MQFLTRLVSCRICKKKAMTDLPRNDICRKCVEALDGKYPKLLRKMRIELFNRLVDKWKQFGLRS